MMKINLKCRVCLNEEENMNLLFFIYDGSKTLARIIEEVLGFVVVKEEEYSDQLCESCTRILVNFTNFKTNFQKATEFFKNNFDHKLHCVSLKGQEGFTEFIRYNDFQNQATDNNCEASSNGNKYCTQKCVRGSSHNIQDQIISSNNPVGASKDITVELKNETKNSASQVNNDDNDYQVQDIDNNQDNNCENYQKEYINLDINISNEDLNSTKSTFERKTNVKTSHIIKNSRLYNDESYNQTTGFGKLIVEVEPKNKNLNSVTPANKYGDHKNQNLNYNNCESSININLNCETKTNFDIGLSKESDSQVDSSCGILDDFIGDFKTMSENEIKKGTITNKSIIGSSDDQNQNINTYMVVKSNVEASQNISCEKSESKCITKLQIRHKKAPHKIHSKQKKKCKKYVKVICNDLDIPSVKFDISLEESPGKSALQKLCKICKRTILVDEFDLHFKTHKVHKCKICDHSFLRKTDLNDHEETHLNVCKYVCQHCGKAFKVRTSLNKHRRIHTNPREVICDICGQCFNTKDALKTHNKLKHKVSKEFQCNLCGLAFTLKSTLEKHIERHNPNRKKIYSCILCDVSYMNKYNLNRHHVIKHTAFENRPSCEFCGKKYTKKADLLKHLKKIHVKDIDG